MHCRAALRRLSMNPYRKSLNVADSIFVIARPASSAVAIHSPAQQRAVNGVPRTSWIAAPPAAARNDDS